MHKHHKSAPARPARSSLLAARAAVVAALLALAPASSEALIVKTWDGVGTPSLINTSAPADDPGWANLPTNRTGIYLGDGLVLTAIHEGGVGTLNIAGGSFPLIPASTTTLSNPDSFGVRRTSNGTLDTNSDLRLYRVGVDTTTGLSPEELDPSIRRISLADRLPSTAVEQLTIFGSGAHRLVNTANTDNGQYYFDSGGSVLSDPADWPSASYNGFRFSTPPATNPRTWQWGKNLRTSQRGGAYGSGSNILMEGSLFQDTIGFQMKFDELGLADEAQGGAGDSGGSVFWKDGDEWVLAGLMHAIYVPDNNNSLIGAFGGYTAVSDLSFDHYRDQIEAARGVFSLMGDLDLDGSVTGSIVNGEATGDLGILVDHWLEDSGAADIHSWMNGDLNQDGFTDLADFVLMREALGGSISSSSFALLVSAQGIPEPGSAALAAACLLAAFGRRRGQ